jgi:hypothetical protein
MPAAKFPETMRPPSTGSNRPPPANAQSKAPSRRQRKPKPSPQMKNSPVQSTITMDNVTERQLDVSIPSEKQAPDVDLEIVQLVLATKDIHAQLMLDVHVSNDWYRRYTLQFKDKQGKGSHQSSTIDRQKHRSRINFSAEYCSIEMLLFK